MTRADGELIEMRTTGCVDVVWNRVQQRDFFHEPLHLADDGTRRQKVSGYDSAERHTKGAEGKYCCSSVSHTNRKKERNEGCRWKGADQSRGRTDRTAGWTAIDIHNCDDAS